MVGWGGVLFGFCDGATVLGIWWVMFYLTISQPLTWILCSVNSWSNGWMDVVAFVCGWLGMVAITLDFTPSTIGMLFPFIGGVFCNVSALLGNGTLASRLALFVILVLFSWLRICALIMACTPSTIEVVFLLSMGYWVICWYFRAIAPLVLLLWCVLAFVVYWIFQQAVSVALLCLRQWVRVLCQLFSSEGALLGCVLLPGWVVRVLLVSFCSCVASILPFVKFGLPVWLDSRCNGIFSGILLVQHRSHW